MLQAVLNSVINHQHVPVRVNGPVGGESILSEAYDQLLLVSGGVGVSLTLYLVLSAMLIVHIHLFPSAMIHTQH